ncbi:MAG: hypothetical protein CL610_07530 [Anaerolineaceae bacterium]|nr:hypothetical protein [Anaerolineaceae bacterium]
MLKKLHPIVQLTERRSFTVLIAILIVRGLILLPVITQPTWVDHEADFFNVTHFLLRYGHMPTAQDFVDQPGAAIQATQPPLYYLLTAPLLLPLDTQQPVPPPDQPANICFGWTGINQTYPTVNDRYWYDYSWQSPATIRMLLRGFNIVLTSLAIVVLYSTVRRIIPNKRGAALLAAGIMAFEPTTLMFTTYIGNEALLLLIVAVHLYAAVRIAGSRTLNVRDWALLGTTSVLAILTRLNGWALLLLTGLILLASIRTYLSVSISPKTRKRIFLLGGAMIVTILGIMAINWLTIGSPFGRYAELEEVLAAALPNFLSPKALWYGTTAIMQHTGVYSYLSPLGFLDRPRLITAFGWFSLMTIVVALVGFGLWWRRKAVHWKIPTFLLAAVASGVLLVLLRNSAAFSLTTPDSSTLIYAPLRYYLPALPPAAILIAIGLTQIRFAAIAGVVLMFSWVIAGAVNALNLPVYDQPSREAVIVQSPDPSQANEITHFDESLPQLLSYQMNIAATDGVLDLTLITQAARPMPANYAARVRLTAPAGNEVACQFQLANGVYPSMVWQPEEAIKTEARIPVCLSNLPAGTTLDLLWVADGLESPAISLGQLAQAVSRSATCPPLLGAIDGGLVIQYTAPVKHHIGDLYLPAVNWYVTRSMRAVSRAYRLEHVDGLAQYTCEGTPRLNSYPFEKWQPGETVYFDECPMPIPADAPPGTYQVLMAASDANGSLLPAQSASSEVGADGWLPVATVEFVLD